MTILATTLALTACAGSPSAEEEHVEQTSQALMPHCPSWGCGENSPLLGPFDMHELDALGAVNTEGVRLLGFRKGMVMYQPIVTQDRLTARDPLTGTVLTGSALAGGAFVVEHPASPSGAPGGLAEVIVTHVTEAATSPITFWQGPATPVETYELDYTGAGLPPGIHRPLCRNPPVPYKVGVPPLVDGHWFPNRFEAVIYTGDRYLASTKTVTASSYATAGTFFNIACAGGALLKLHLNRHTTASSIPGFETTASQRQAMLKMYAGDFCGTGESFTEQGTRIHWESSTGLTSPPGNAASYESLWTASGALCLSTHRLEGISTYDYEGAINGTGSIHGRCPKPQCSSLALEGFASGVGVGRVKPYLRTQSAALP
jgi:hypothetical protein